MFKQALLAAVLLATPALAQQTVTNPCAHGQDVTKCTMSILAAERNQLAAELTNARAALALTETDMIESQKLRDWVDAYFGKAKASNVSQPRQ